MPSLDYSNLPLLLTTREAAELFRVSVAQFRSLRRERPGWLEPVPAFAGRSKLYARAEILRAAGLAAWPDPVSTAEMPTLEAAARDRAREVQWQLHKRQAAARAVRECLANDNPPIARGDRLGYRSFVHWRATDNHDFTFWMYWQPRHRPPGWPARIDLPRASPSSTIRLDTDEQARAVGAEIDEIMREYQPLWDLEIAGRRAVRKLVRQPV